MPNICASFKNVIFLAFCVILLTACQQAPKVFSTSVTGTWIVEKDGSTMLDPQTSGLSFVNGHLYSVSDASAHASQIQRLHKLSAEDGRILEKLGPIQPSEKILASCFLPYLLLRPDYEAIVKLPDNSNAWLLVTEDARRGPELSAECQQRFKDTGSTDHPTLIVRVELLDDQLLATGVRAIQFDPKDEVGKFDNDGIEGLSITRDSRVLLGLEKDMNAHPRVFEFSYSPRLFDEVDTFVPVQDSGLKFPPIVEGKHPINGMDVYYPNEESDGFLIAAARNADQLWILDLAKKRPATVIDIAFFAPSANNNETNNESQNACANTHQMVQTAIEGVAVNNGIIYLVNDPWKERYQENVSCDVDQERYENMSPLFFKLDIDNKWFE